MDKKDRLNEAFKYLRSKGLAHTQKDIADKIGSSAPNVSNAMKGVDKFLTTNFLLRLNSAYGNIFNNDWLLTGEGEMLASATQIDIQEEKNRKDNKINAVYLLPTSALAGSLSGFSTSVREWECEKVISPFAGAEMAISIYGHSMEPDYPQGGKVFIKRINETAFIEWGKVYVLDTDNGTVLKVLTPSDKENHVRCLSINTAPQYAPFDVPSSAIHGIYRVLGYIVKQ